MVTLDSEVLTQALEFGANLGLARFIIDEAHFSDPIFKLYIIRADKLVPVYYNMHGEVHPEGIFVELEERAIKEQINCYHTHLSPVKALANGYMNRELIDGLPAALEIMFHEGFHRRPRGKLHNFLEESAAKLVGLQAAVAFCDNYKYKDLYSQMQEKLQSAENYTKLFEKRLHERLDDLKAGNTIPQNESFNNAKLYVDYLSYGHYPLFNDVFCKIGTFRGFIELVSGLPKEFKEAKRILEAVRLY